MSAVTPFAGAFDRAHATYILYRRLIAVQIRTEMEYHVSFVLNVAGTFVATAAGFATTVLALQRFSGIGGWPLGEITFLYGIMDLTFWRYGLRHYTGTGT